MEIEQKENEVKVTINLRDVMKATLDSVLKEYEGKKNTKALRARMQRDIMLICFSFESMERFLGAVNGTQA